ncbi:MAG TPA: hypothetical protein VII34_10260 [Pyrinomonadaceae bacterium]
MRTVQRLIAAATILLTADVNRGSTSTQAHEPDELVKWVFETGKPAIMRARVATSLGVGDQDISVTERGLRVIGEETTHVIGVRLGPDLTTVDFIFLAQVIEEDGSGIVWKCSALGQLQNTIVMSPDGEIKRISNDTRLGEFLAEREYFQRQLRETIVP